MSRQLVKDGIQAEKGIDSVDIEGIENDVLLRYVGDDAVRGGHKDPLMHPLGTAPQMGMAEVEDRLDDIPCLAE